MQKPNNKEKMAIPPHLPYLIIARLLTALQPAASQQYNNALHPLAPQPWPATLSQIAPPEGCQRIGADSTSFAAYLRSLPLRPQGTPVRTYDGRTALTTHYAYAVIDQEIGTRDLQQCADAIIRLRAEWLYSQRRYADIAFHLTNGFLCQYSRWAEGERVRGKNKSTTWYPAAQRDYSYPTFRSYLDFIFTYAGTISLHRETRAIGYAKMQIGDLFITADSSGHAILVADIAVNPTTKEKYFLVLEGYMPAQDIHILTNPITPQISPWYSLSQLRASQSITFPTYSYLTPSLRRFSIH